MILYLLRKNVACILSNSSTLTNTIDTSNSKHLQREQTKRCSDLPPPESILLFTFIFVGLLNPQMSNTFRGDSF